MVNVSDPHTYLVVDAGTSRTRVRLWRVDRVIDELEAQVGARDVAAGGAARTAGALQALIASLRERHALQPSAVVCSGMITSDVGLVEVPHVQAPIALGELALRLIRQDIHAISELPMYFIPGIKTLASTASWDTLHGFDVMRGEETEAVGLLSGLDCALPLTFFHCGSHHKLIELAEADHESRQHGRDRSLNASVVRSSTALTGELLAAIRQSTILASNLSALEGIEIDMDAVMAGARASRAAGFARAAFLVRVGGTIAGLARDAATSFLLGALADLDLQLIEREASPDHEIVVYGGGLFPAIVSEMLAREGTRTVRLVPPQLSERAATIGAVRLLETHLSQSAGARA